jgi:hypothetical protein
MMKGEDLDGDFYFVPDETEIYKVCRLLDTLDGGSLLKFQLADILGNKSPGKTRGSVIAAESTCKATDAIRIIHLSELTAPPSDLIKLSQPGRHSAYFEDQV